MGRDVVIQRVDPAEQPDFPGWVQAHQDETAPTAPPESRHALDVEDFSRPGMRLWLARDRSNRIVGSLALAPVAEGHEELKSMRVEPSMRGRGLGGALLETALADAAARGIERVSLETGSMAFFEPARSVYRRAGFTECGPFGAYAEDPLSVFMTLQLRSAGASPDRQAIAGGG